MRACKSNGALRGDPLLEVLKRWFQSVVARTKKEFICCSEFEWGTKNGLDFPAQLYVRVCVFIHNCMCVCVCLFIIMWVDHALPH